MGRYLKKKITDFFKYTFVDVGKVPNNTQSQHILIYEILNFRLKNQPCNQEKIHGFCYLNFKKF
jgi:hypothetical protein